MRRIYCFLIFWFIFVSVAHANVAKVAGLGDTFSSIEAAWNKGYKHVFPIGRICIGIDQQRAICYDPHTSFGKPTRAGDLDGDVRGIFGAEYGGHPTRKQFFKGIKDLMPKDFKLKTAWHTNQGTYITETYSLTSKSLAALPGIKAAWPYSSDKKLGFVGAPVGTFLLIVNYEAGNKNKVTDFTLTLGQPGEPDLYKAKRIIYNPFKK